MTKFDGKHWFVLNFINRCGTPSPKAHIDKFNLEGHSLELFAPVISPAQMVNGKVRYPEKLLTFYYVFVRGEFEEVKELCMRTDNNLSFLLDRSSDNRYATVSDADMNNFRIIARAHTNAIPFFNIEDVDLTEGDIVEIVGGAYDGLRGVFMPRSRSNKGNLIISATASMGAVLWDINASAVRILQFARDTRRQYDVLDSFIPKLLAILRKFSADEPLTLKEKSQLTIFNRRMGVVGLDNHKAEAKLLAVLMCVQFILGDIEALASTRERFERRKATVTNVWTAALIELMLAVTQNDMQRLANAYGSLRNITDAPTRTQQLLLAEFEHYLC